MVNISHMASEEPELKGVVIISLPPPDNPSQGKTVYAAIAVRGVEEGSGQLPRQQERQTHQQEQPHQQQPPLQQVPRQQLQRGSRFGRRGRANLRRVSAIFLSGFLFAMWHWSPYSMNFDGPDRKDDEDGKDGVYVLYPKYRGVDMLNYDEPPLKLGVFVERDLLRRKNKNYDASKNYDGSKVVASANSSAVFPIKGDVYPHGLYYVSMLIGNPPESYYLDVDTGSDLLWLQCDAPCRSCAKGPHTLYKPKKGQLVSCHDSMCMSMQSDQKYECKSPSQQCDYNLLYADHSSSMGVLVRDSIRILLTNGSVGQTNLVFGCAYDQLGSLANSPAMTDGVLGLSGAQVSLPSQLASKGFIKNVIGHCIAGDERGGGYMFFGNDFVPTWGMTWVQMRGKPSMKLYDVGNPSMKIGNRPLASNGPENNLGRVVFDSGSSFTYLTHQAYIAFVSMIKESLYETELTRDSSDSTLPICWRGYHPFRSIADVRRYFNPLVLDFGVNPWLIKSKQFEIPPEGYLVINSQGNVCLGILDGSDVPTGQNPINIIGDISLQGYMVVYDNANGRIGWVRADCHKPPKIKPFPFF